MENSNNAQTLVTFVEDRIAGMVFAVGVVSLRTLVLTFTPVVLTARPGRVTWSNEVSPRRGRSPWGRVADDVARGLVLRGVDAQAGGEQVG